MTTTLTAPPSSASYNSVSTRLRAESTATTAPSQSTESLAVTTSEVSPKRQTEFERLFADQLRERHPLIPLDELLTVVATQSGDLQAKVLLHGRLYLTRHHLCFRSNILGYKTENIHPLSGIRSVKRGTTAKWIQNAVYIVEDDHEVGDYIGYGSLADRDAMYDRTVDCWKSSAPDRHQAWLDRGSVDELVPAEEEVPEVPVEAPIEELPVKATECTGEGHLEEIALDTVVGMPLDTLFDLVYHDPNFMTDFYTNDKGLTDLVISGWSDGEGEQMRTLTYVMHMDNKIGPSQSDCNGSETIVVDSPHERYEILSETQTPGVPSGSKFKIHTRTCLTQATIKGTQATRMYCTTQCDWSSGSWLKGTITPAVIKGQKEHHQMLLRKLKRYMTEHPDQFAPDTEGGGSEVVEAVAEEGEGTKTGADGPGAEVTVKKSFTQHAHDIPDNPVMLGVIGFLLGMIMWVIWA